MTKVAFIHPPAGTVAWEVQQEINGEWTAIQAGATHERVDHPADSEHSEPWFETVPLDVVSARYRPRTGGPCRAVWVPAGGGGFLGDVEWITNASDEPAKRPGGR